MKGALVIGGNGGREAAISAAIQESLQPEAYIVQVTNNETHEGLQALNYYGVDSPLIVIGSEAPLVNGLSDFLRSFGHTVLGVSKAAAQYEASKAKTVRLAEKYGIIQPNTFIAEGQDLLEKSIAYMERREPESYVIKANGLAAGQGVVLPKNRQEAERVVRQMVNGAYSGAGQETILFADRKKGSEVSAMVLVGGGKDDFLILPLAQDYKRLKDGNRGPNTGGMGAYAPVPETIVNEKQYAAIERKAYSLLDAMEQEGTPFNRGVMYMGLMMSEDLKGNESDLIEINVRFGDPETQVILPLLLAAGVDVHKLLRSAAEGKLIKPSIDMQKLGKTALTVCLAASGYPGKPVTGEVINGLGSVISNDKLKVYLAGARVMGEEFIPYHVTDGGRVLYVTGLGEDLSEAAANAYSLIGRRAIHFNGMRYRKDIGQSNS